MFNVGVTEYLTVYFGAKCKVACAMYNKFMGVNSSA